MSWIVHKFGGTSVADANRYKGVVKLLSGDLIYPHEERQQQKLNLPVKTAVVVSAMTKVTDALIEIIRLAQNQNLAYLEALENLKNRHIQTVHELLPLSLQAEIELMLYSDFENLKEILRGVWHLRSCSQPTLDLVSGHGEIWSAQFLNSFCRSEGLSCDWLDARQVLVVEPHESSVNILWEESQSRLDQWLSLHPSELLIITGFIASTPTGLATTLRRNGSDHSASIFGALLKSESISIWTDVDGVLSADPRLVSEAVVLKDLSYQEATELAYFGAKVVHPSTMAPAILNQIPIWIRNTFRPELPGTKIHKTSDSTAAVKGFATIDQVALLNVEGTGMIGVPGIAQRLFGALKEVGVSVIMISQASSEHSICFAVPLEQAVLARRAVEMAFAIEIQSGAIQTIEVSDDCSILAAVGDNMVHRPGLAGQLMSALGNAGVNIRAIAQGSSERNISVVVKRNHSKRALRTVHAAFFLSTHTLSIGVIGVGGVGATLLTQLQEAALRLRQELKIDLRVRGIANSKKMLLSETGLELSKAVETLQTSTQYLHLESFVRHVHAEHLPHAVIIDCTAQAEIAACYSDWLSSGVHVITPNKKANTQSMPFYQNLKKKVARSQRHYLYETTVGAGLPILNTLRELVRTGDQILEVEGVLSGTLSFLFNSFSQNRSFSEVVLEARKRGYTEPDPREDLSGMDVARKLVILAREMGLSLELSDVKVEPLLTEDSLQGDVSHFLKNISSYDTLMKQKFQEAQVNGEVLRFVGCIDRHGKAWAGLKRYSQDHTFSRLRGTDNAVAFHTVRYQQPLIVQGPGAGPAVTAAGVFADLLRLSSYLGAPL